MHYSPFFPPEADLSELQLEIQAFEPSFLLDEEIESLNGNFMEFKDYLIAFDMKGFVILEKTPENLEEFKQKRFKQSNSNIIVNPVKLNYICNKAIYLKSVLDLTQEIPDLKWQLKRCNLDQETLNQILNKMLFYSDFHKMIELFEFAIKNDELENLFEFIFLLREAFSENWKTYARNVFSKGAGVLGDEDIFSLQDQILDFALNFEEPKQEIVKTSNQIESKIKESIAPEVKEGFISQGDETNWFSGKEPSEYDYLGGTIFEDWYSGILISNLAIALGSSFRKIDFNVNTEDLITASTFYVEKPVKELNVPFGSKINEYQLTESGVIFSFSMFDYPSSIEYEKRVLEKVRESQITNEELDFVIDLLPKDLPNEITNLQDMDINAVIAKLIQFLGQCTYNNSELVGLNENPNSIFEFVLKNKIGNCLAYSQLIAAILNANGYETYLALTNNSYDSEKGFSSVGHAVLLIVNPENGRIIEFDATKYLKKSRSERFIPHRKNQEEGFKHDIRTRGNQRFFDSWLDYEGKEINYIDYEKLRIEIQETHENEPQSQNTFTLRNFLNAVIKNRNNYHHLISDADYEIFKSFLDEEVELDFTHIKTKELQFKLKLLGVNSKISIFDLFDFYFALTDERDRQLLLQSPLMNACFLLIYYSIDNYLEITDSLEVNSGNFISPDFDSLMDDDLELLISQVIKERFSQELIENFRKLKKQKDSPKIIYKSNQPKDISFYEDRHISNPKFRLRFEEDTFLSVFEGISKRLKKQAFRSNQSPEWDSVREYQVGDDVRFINHKVTARTGKTHVNVYKNTEVSTPDQSILIVPFCTEPQAWVDMDSMTFKLIDLAIKENVTIKVYNSVDQCIHTFLPQELKEDNYGTLRHELNKILKLLNIDGQVPLIPDVDCMETVYLNVQPGSLYQTAFKRVQSSYSKKGMKCRVIDAKLSQS